MTGAIVEIPPINHIEFAVAFSSRPKAGRALAAERTAKVWRMSAAAPLGEWIDPNAPPPPTPRVTTEPENVPQGGWVRSSAELLKGLKVAHHETIPADLFDEIFGDIGPVQENRDS